MNWYCDFAQGRALHEAYHDKEYGFPSRDEMVLFERMAMEIMQAGLSWDTVLKKRAALNAAFDGFDVDKVAAYGGRDMGRLLADAGIIRNRLKVEAIIANAKVIQSIREAHGSLAAWLDSHHPQPKEAWVKLFRRTFRFMGPEIVNEFLMGLGYLPGAHHKKCPVYRHLLKLGRSPASQRRQRGR